MHYNNSKPIVLCVISNDFSNSLSELKPYLNFSLLFSNDLSNDISQLKYDAILIEAENLSYEFTQIINLTRNKAKLLICKSNEDKIIHFDQIMHFPLNFDELNNKILQLISSKEFFDNSSLNIKNYLLDKNEKKIKKKSLFIALTEKEIQLIELLFNSKKPIKKNKILELIWKYSTDADTHTVETHIYRLRKKIDDKFGDSDFIVNTKDGYLI